MESIIQKDTNQCFMCGATRWLEWHHIFGAALKKKSEKYKLMVRLCHYCHNEPPMGVHHNREQRRHLRAYTQRKAMKYYGWTTEQFIENFGKNYID